MLFSDQNFSFLPKHLEALAAQADLEVMTWAPPPEHISLRDKQLVVLRSAGAARPTPFNPPPDAGQELYQRRCAYLDNWQRCHEKLKKECEGARNVYNFGTSTWSFLLAGYCSQYWKQVTACIIDQGAGEFFGKPVRDASEITFSNDDVIVLGVDPGNQSRFAGRFADSAARLVVWNDLVKR
jgi:hypothetical protein